MTTPHKWADVIKAWADGQEVQYYSDVSPERGWQKFKLESATPWGPWNSANGMYKWRIKPETVKYRRYLWQDFPSIRVGIVDRVDYAQEVAKFATFIRWIDDEWQEIDV